MTGNVWEWCIDWFNENEYHNRGGKILEDPQGSENGISHSLRGGSWNRDKELANVSYRTTSISDIGTSNIGFRVMLSPSN